MRIKQFVIVIFTLVILVCTQSLAGHLFTNHLFLLGDEFEVHILGENDYSLTGHGLDAVRELLVKSVRDEWDDEGNNSSNSMVSVVSLRIYSGKGDEKHLAMRIDIKTTIFRNGKQGYDALIEAVRKRGVAKRGNGSARFEDGWKIEGAQK